MGSAAFKRNLIHACDIQKPTESRSTTGEITRTWATATGGSGIACRYVQKREAISSESEGFAMKQWDLLLLDSAGSAVAVEEYRVKNIRFAVGSGLVDAGPFTIEGVLGRNSTKAHHISINLERIE